MLPRSTIDLIWGDMVKLPGGFYSTGKQISPARPWQWPPRRANINHNSLKLSQLQQPTQRGF